MLHYRDRNHPLIVICVLRCHCGHYCGGCYNCHCPQVVVLYVDEETSIKRQLQRARVASLHNRRVLDAGAGHFFEERSTDTDIDKCRKRYAIFKTHYAAT